ncbi:hypothetical protein ACLB2K_052592 [Fragaria x ananassa]
MFKTTWNINGNFPVEPANGGRLLFMFSNPNNRNRVWRGGLWGFNHASVALAQYDEVDEVPLVKSSYWIALLKVPLVFAYERLMRTGRDEGI